VKSVVGTYSPSAGGTEVGQVPGHCCRVPLGGANCPRRQLTQRNSPAVERTLKVSRSFTNITAPLLPTTIRLIALPTVESVGFLLLILRAVDLLDQHKASRLIETAGTWRSMLSR
jgi:hypothetical protein